MRFDRSVLPVATSVAAPWIASALPRMLRTMRVRFAFIVISARNSSPNSSCDVTLIAAVRSPAATWLASSSPALSGRVIERVIQIEARTPMASAKMVRATITRTLVALRSDTAWAVPRTCFTSVSCTWSSFSETAICTGRRSL